MKTAFEAPTVLLHGVRSETAEGVARACERAGARFSRALADAGDASLLVAQIPSGTRRIPDEVVTILASGPPAMPLLLLCDEPLAMPSTTLHHGRVTLLEQPCSTERLYSRIRVLLNGAPHAPAHHSERTCARFWSADLGAVTSEIVPHDSIDDEEGVLGVVPLSEGFSAEEKLPELRAIFRSTREPAERSRALTALLGARGGVIYLSPRAQEWTLYWPPNAGALWFFSHARLPRVSELSRASQAAALFRLGASSGDVALGLAAPLSFDASDNGSGPLDSSSSLSNGGPALLDRVAQLAADMPRAFIAEVR